MSTVYVLQELPGTSIGQPKFNIMGASKFGTLKTLLRERAQITLTPGPMIQELRKMLKDFTDEDYLLLTGDPGKFKLLKWDKQEKLYYPVEINLFPKA
jgi:hypothetical protein